MNIVNPGQPSRGCAICKKRKIKCDQLTPTCTQCEKAGWTCPGPSNPGAFSRHQTTADTAGKTAGSNAMIPMDGSSREPETWKRPLSYPAGDKATTFFMRQYIFDTSNNYSFPLKDNHEYLPILIQKEESPFGLLSTVPAAAGYAALSNAGNVAEWRSESFRLYQIAIVQMQQALQDPVQRVSDETLGAVLLMGTFETIAI
ncbi:hypothetical protein FSHL1_010137 [Fusarium sambucinum]